MGLDFIKSKEFLEEDYRPSDDEPFMNENQVEFFRKKHNLPHYKADNFPYWQIQR